jgi:PIN domain nuclease of toxin-antitoxin system
MSVLLADGRFGELPVTIRHAAAVERLPMPHADPFDRVLIVQAQIEGLTIASRDPAIRRYDVRTLW